MRFSEKFICAGKEYSTWEKHVPAPYFRKEFDLDKDLFSAEITVTGLGFYMLYINGKDVTKGILAPYISNPDHIVYYDNYDISKYLVKGKNVIALVLGNGFQNNIGGEVWDFNLARFRSSPKCALTFEAKLSDGSEFSFEADETFKTAPSPILFDDMRCGVHYDARNEIDGWNLPGFDDSDWKNAEFADKPRGDFRLCTVEPITCQYECEGKLLRKTTLAPYTAAMDYMQAKCPVYKPVNNEGYLYDFGINAAGTARIKVNGRPGQLLELQFLEYVTLEGVPSCTNLQFFPDGYVQRVVYTCKGGEETFVVPFTYFGCQYCMAMGLDDDQVQDFEVTYLVCNSDLKERGSFECSDEVANKLQSMVRVSDLANFYYFPTDCPQREKNGWTGDAALSAEQFTLNFAVENSLSEWMRSIVKSQKENGEISGVVPTTTWGYDNGPAWDIVMFNIPYYTYIYRGETDMIKEHSAALLQYLHWISTRRDERGLVWVGLRDWCPVTVIKAERVFTSSLTVMDMCRKASVMFGAIGMNLAKAFADGLFAELKASVRNHLIDFGTMTADGRCQTAQAMAIYYGAFEPAERPAAFKVLLDIIHENDDFIDVGVLGGRVLFHVLSEGGEGALAYKMITRPEYPSYGFCVKQGMTSLPEDFTTPRLDRGVSSLNHHFWGDISNWFISKVAGIRVNPYGNDPSCVNIVPDFISSLDHATAHYDTVKGRVSVSWKRDGENILLTVERPEDVTGRVLLNNGWYCHSLDYGMFCCEEESQRGVAVFHHENNKTYILRKKTNSPYLKG